MNAKNKTIEVGARVIVTPTATKSKPAAPAFPATITDNRVVKKYPFGWYIVRNNAGKQFEALASVVSRA